MPFDACKGYSVSACFSRVVVIYKYTWFRFRNALSSRKNANFVAKSLERARRVAAILKIGDPAVTLDHGDDSSVYWH